MQYQCLPTCWSPGRAEGLLPSELQNKGFLSFIKGHHLMNHLSIIRASSLELEAPYGAMLTTLGPDINNLLNTVKIGEVSV